MKKLHDIDDYHGLTSRDSREAFHHRFTEEQDIGASITLYTILLAILAAGLFLLLCPVPLHAGQPILIDPTTGKYLGNLNSNSLDPNSVANPVGRYGSSVSPDSINNPVGRYGSPTGSDSVNNPYATRPTQLRMQPLCPRNLNLHCVR